ncbi:MAG: extracellular solute-binding protein [Myxococcota bacterium]
MLPRRRFLGGVAAMVASSMMPGCRPREQPGPERGTSAARAVRAARAYEGTRLTIASESGAQAQGLLQKAVPAWEELTGVRVEVLELGMPGDMVRRLLSEHAAGTGAIDCTSLPPAFLADLVADGALAPLDDLVARHMDPADLDDYLPRYRDLGVSDGRRYGLFDDGDTLLLYYRRDLFEDPGVHAAFRAATGRPLGDPRTWGWDEFVAAARYFTDAADVRYGLAPFTEDLLWGWFQTYFRARQGRFFDPDTMRAEVDSEAGRRTMTDLLSLASWTLPGAFGEGDLLLPVSTWLSGSAAMATFWPPLARWAEGYGESPFGRTPATAVAGRTGYALLPGGVTQLLVGFVLSVMASSRNHELAYLFLQWLSSPEISLDRVMLPYALRDPFRRSHVRSPAYRALWPGAPEYLDTLETAAERSYFDLGLPGALDYQLAFRIALAEIRQGTDVDTAMRHLAARWDEVTARHGARRQRAAYALWLAGATPRTHP